MRNKLFKKLSGKYLMLSLLVLPASTNYKLEGVSFGNAGGGSIGSSNYEMNASAGDINSGKMSGNSYDLGMGLMFVENTSVPRAAALVNDGNYYNKLHLTINNTNLSNDNSFPSTGVLENFNRSDGAIGSNWDSSDPANITSNEALLNDSYFVSAQNIWKPQSFGANQEAFFTITQLQVTNPDSSISLVLKNQSNSYTSDSHVLVVYRHAASHVQVYVRDNGVFDMSRSPHAATFSVGDVFGARVYSDGTLLIFKNGAEIVSEDVSSFSHKADSGWIGFRYYLGTGTESEALDNFGGGNITSSTVPSPADTRYAVAISKDNWATTQYVKSDLTLGNNLTISDFQTFDDWGGVEGVNIIGLQPATTYKVRVKARRGKFSESGLGPASEAATINPILTFDIDVSPTDSNTDGPYMISLNDLNPGSLVTSNEKVWVSLETNASSGGSVFVYGQNSGLRSTSAGYTISSVSGDLGVLSNGFGVQGVGATQAGGGPFMVDDSYNLTSNNVGMLDDSVRQIFRSTNALIAGRGSFLVKAKSDNQAPAAADYGEILTVIAAVNY